MMDASWQEHNTRTGDGEEFAPMTQSPMWAGLHVWPIRSLQLFWHLAERFISNGILFFWTWVHFFASNSEECKSVALSHWPTGFRNYRKRSPVALVLSSLEFSLFRVTSSMWQGLTSRQRNTHAKHIRAIVDRQIKGRKKERCRYLLFYGTTYHALPYC